MNAAERAEIRERADKAMDAPWEVIQSRDVLPAVVAPGRASICIDCDSIENANFIAHARTDITKLLDDRDAAEERIKELTEALRDAINEYEGAVMYRSEYLQKKFKDADEIARLRAVLERQVAE